MKKINIVIASLAILTLGSCSDFLSEVPDNRTQLDSPEKISELLVNAYPGRDYMYFTEAMTDNFADTKRRDNEDISNSKYFRFEDNLVPDFDSPSWYWESAYLAIAHANQALQAVNDSSTPEKLSKQKGEALLARAYAHFMLVNIFGQAYDPATASSELGIPYMEDVEKNLIANYKRNSIQEVYDLIEKDLIEGIELVGVDSDYNKRGYHFTKNAGRALATKFYVYKGEWDKALEYSENLGDFPSKLKNLNDVATLSIDERSQTYSARTAEANLLLSAGNSIHAYGLGTNRYGTTRTVQTELDNNFNPFGKTWNYANRWVSYGEDVFLQSKFYMHWIMEGGNTTSGQPYQTFVLLSNEDMYLNRIEATAMKGDLDKAAKMIAHFAQFKTVGFDATDLGKVTKSSVLNMVRTASEYEAFYTMDPEVQRFVKYIAEVRRRDFVGEGARWFDIKRFNLEVKHVDLITGEEFILNKKDLRKAIQLPSHVSQYGVELNPR